jgi:hypothetical protein
MDMHEHVNKNIALGWLLQHLLQQEKFAVIPKALTAFGFCYTVFTDSHFTLQLMNT